MLFIFLLFPATVVFFFVFLCIKYFPHRFKGFKPLTIQQDENDTTETEIQTTWSDRYLKNDFVFKFLRFITQYWVKLFIAIYIGVMFYSFLLELFF